MIQPFKPYISRFDKAFKEDHTRHYHLTIRIAMDGFSLVVFSPEKNRFLGLTHFRFPDIDTNSKLSLALDGIAMSNVWISYPFQSVIAMIDHPHHALIPKALYDEKERGTYLAFNQQYCENSRIVSDQLKTAESYNIYYLSNLLTEKIKELWANTRIVHQSSILIESLLISQRNLDSDKSIFAHIGKNNFDLVWINKDRLSFFNRFRFHTPEDFIYFILFTLDQLRLNPETLELVLSGQIDKGSPYYEIAWNYIRNIRFASRNQSFDYSYVLEDLPVYQHMILYNALQCEL